MMDQLALSFTNVATPATATTGQRQIASVAKYVADNPIHDTILSGADIVPVSPFFVLPMLPSSAGKLQLVLNKKMPSLLVHDHALGQICGKLEVPRNYIRKLLSEKTEWASELAAENLLQLFRERARDKKFLLRSVHGEVRGFLSNAYGRLATASILETFSATCQELNVEPFWGYAATLKTAVQGAFVNKWKVGDHFVYVGVMLNHSEFGAGALNMRFFLAPTPTRTIVSNRGIHKIHKGRRLTLENLEEVHTTDTQAASNLIHTELSAYLLPSNVSAIMAEVALTIDMPVDPDKVLDLLKTMPIDEDEAAKIELAFKTRTDLPKGNNMYRLANTFAWAAEDEPDTDRKLDLMHLAGSLVLPEK